MKTRFFMRAVELERKNAVPAALSVELAVLWKLGLCVLLLFLCQLCSAQQCTGAPTYSCAVTFPFVDPLPAPLPSWGSLTGANTKFCDATFDPGYAVCYVRLTDANTLTPPKQSFAVDASTSGARHWNSSDTMIWYANQGNGILVDSFDPNTMATALVSSVANQYCCNGHWSQANPNWLYTVTSAGVLTRLDFTPPLTGGQPAASTVFNFANCGVSGMVIDFSGIGGNDTVFAATFGPAQDTSSAVYVAAYNATSGKCYLYNTGAAEVFSYSGGSPALMGATTPSTNTFYIHGAGMADQSGQWIVVTESQTDCPSCAGLFYAWNIGTTTLYYCGNRGDCEGHWTANPSGWFNNAGTPESHNPSLLYRTWSSFATANYVNLNTGGTGKFNSTLDIHPSPPGGPQGEYPIVASTYDTGSGFQAYSDEIIAFAQPFGPVRRFGHTFSDARDPNYQAQQALGAVSNSAGYFAFTTNALGTLGSMPAYLASCSESGTTATCNGLPGEQLTTAQWPTGSSIVVSGNSVSGYNGTWTVTGRTSSSLSFSVSPSGLGTGTGGIASEAACTLSLGNCRSDVFVVSLVPVPGNITLTSSTNPSVVGQSVSLTATVSGVNGVTPTGNVTFYYGYGYPNNSSEIGGTNYPGNPAPLMNGQASFTWTFNVSKAPAYIYAVYSGDAHYNPGYSPMLRQVINQ